MPAGRFRRSAFAWTAAAAIVAGTGASLAGAVGVQPALFRPLGGTALFLGLLSIPLWIGVDSIDVAIGVFVAAFVAAIGMNVSVVAGTVLLSGLSVVGVPIVVVAVGVGGAVAGIAAALGGRRLTTAFGIGLVLAAGVPASLPAATATMLGVTATAIGEGEVR